MDVDNKRKDAYLVSSTNNDPTATLRITTLYGLPPNVQYRVQAVNTPAVEWPVDISQPPNLLPNVAGDGRVTNAPKLRFTRVKGQKGGRQLRLYLSRGVSKNNVTNGIRVEVLRVHKTGPVTLESAFNIFSGTNVRMCWRPGWRGCGRWGLGLGVCSRYPPMTHTYITEAAHLPVHRRQQGGVHRDRQQRGRRLRHGRGPY